MSFPLLAPPSETDASTAALGAAALGTAPAPERLRRREAVYRRLLAASDALATALVFVVCLRVVERASVGPAVLLAPVLVVVIAKISNLYDRDHLLLGRRTLDEAPALLQVATLAALVSWLLGPLLSNPALGRAGSLSLWLGLFAGLVLARTVARRISLTRVTPERVLLVGGGAVARRLSVRLAARGATLVGRVPLEEGVSSRLETVPVVGELDRLPKCVKTFDVDRVVLAPAGEHVAMLDLIRATKALGVRVSVLPQLLEAVGSSAEWDDLDGMPLLGLRGVGLSRSSLLIKRSFDLCGATVLLLLAAPVLLITALAVRLDSPGPVLFGQRRVGRQGELFCMWKFRTMCVDAEERKEELLEHNEGADGFFKIADDPRITRVGRFLRRTSLDELPQLFNVLRGEMSLVGPRPLIAAEDRRVEGWYRRRLDLTPGMTGRWQVLGSSRVPLKEMVVLDYLYVADWSLWSDVKILLRTLPRVLGRQGL